MQPHLVAHSGASLRSWLLVGVLGRDLKDLRLLDPENRWGLLLNRGITAAFLDGRIASAPPLPLRREGLTASRSWLTRACLV